ncbi:MAG: carbohydrate kinase family protein [Bacteroidota bacterium]
MPRFDAVALGDLNGDLIITRLAGPPVVDTEVLAEAYNLTLGGSTGIFAGVLGSLGSRVGFVGLIGKDYVGDIVRRRLEAHGVDTAGVIEQPGQQTGLTASLVLGDDRALVTVLGTIAGLKGSDIPWDYIKQAGHLHVGSYYLQTGLRPALGEVFAQAKKLGLTTSLDTGWDPAEQWQWPMLAAILPSVDVFLPNETEALHLTGKHDAESALTAILEAGAGTVAVKRGGRGSIAGRGADRYIAAPRPAKVLDTTGAGDSFDAGFIHRFVAGDDLAACLEFANACGALAVSRVGGADGAPTEAEVRLFMQRRSQVV